MAIMIILGIDPGTTTIGFAFIEKEGSVFRVLDYGVITTPPRISLVDKLHIIYSDLVELLNVYNPDIAGLEKLFFFRNITNGIDVAQARGMILHTLSARGILIDEFTPLQVKKAITGNGNAKKPQIQKAVQQILRLQEIPQPDDAADALAIAYITALSVKK